MNIDFSLDCNLSLPFKFKVFTTPTIEIVHIANLSLPFRFKVLTTISLQSYLLRILPLPFKFQIFTTCSEGRKGREDLSLPLKFAVLTATDIYGKRYQYPVAAFQIQGVYNVVVEGRKPVSPVTTLQSPLN